MKKLFLAATLLAAPLAMPAEPWAAGNDPDWPCIQRKVPELSIGQIWTGPELPDAAAAWQKDAQVAALVAEAAARRVPLEEAQKAIADFAATLPPADAKPRLQMLVRGLFDHMDGERMRVMAGITRYAHKQVAMAAQLREQGAALDALIASDDADPDEVERKTDELTFATRIYDERTQSLTAVCEVPTIIEQRLYQLAKTVQQAMP